MFKSIFTQLHNWKVSFLLSNDQLDKQYQVDFTFTPYKVSILRKAFKFTFIILVLTGIFHLGRIWDSLKFETPYCKPPKVEQALVVPDSTVIKCDSTVKSIKTSFNVDTLNDLVTKQVAYNLIKSNLKWEGAEITDDPDDFGGLTNAGLTFSTFKTLAKYAGYKGTKQEFLKLTVEERDQFIQIFIDTYNTGKFLNPKMITIFTLAYWASNKIVRSKWGLISKVNIKYGEKFNIKGQGVNKGFALEDSFIGFINALPVEEQEVLIQEFVECFIQHSQVVSVVGVKANQHKFLKGWLNRWYDLADLFSKIKPKKIKRNDTIYSICKSHEVLQQNLLEFNGLSSQDSLLYPGQIIYINNI